MIVACYAVCDEANIIAESIRSVKAFVDRFVFVDSAYTHYPRPGTHSSDGTRQIAEAIAAPVPVTYIESDVRMNQPAARNRYIDELAPDDWALVVDADEVLIGERTAARALFRGLRERAEPAVSIRVFTQVALAHGWGKDLTPEEYARAPLSATVGWMPRLFRAGDGYRYRDEEVIFSAGLWRGKELLNNAAVRDDSAFLVNRRACRSHESYVNGCLWMMKDRGLV